MAVSDDQHPDHQLRRNRRPSNPAVIGRQMTTDLIEVHELIHLTKQVICRYMIFKAERVKQTALETLTLTHHHQFLPTFSPHFPDDR